MNLTSDAERTLTTELQLERIPCRGARSFAMANLGTGVKGEGLARLQQTLRKEQGLTLIEIIVVLIILSMLYVFLTGGIFSQGDRAKIQINKMRMDGLKGKVNQYRFQFNSLPPSLTALTGCEGANNQQCVAVASAEDVKDAWGTPFRYQITPGGRTYTVTSFGADTQQGGEGANGDATITGP